MHNSVASLVLIVVLQVTTGQQPYAQRAALYEQNNQGGGYIVIPQTYEADLGTVNFDNRAASFCVTGIWLFYTEINFNQGQNSGMEYVFGPNQFCGNFRTVGRVVSSVRFAGSAQDYRSDTITLYEGTYFQGEEEYTFTDLPSLDRLGGNHASLILTGSTPWTVYDNTNYQGNSVCLYPPQSSDYTPYFLSDTTSVSIPYGTIKSLRKGCWGQKVSEFARFG